LRTRRVMGANPSLCRMLGLLPSGLDGRAFEELFILAERERAGRLGELLEPPTSKAGPESEGAGARTELEAHLLRQDGTAVLAELRAVEVEIDGERCALVTIRDVSEKKRLQEQ